jgi:metal-sulfur cluster biosynthetic enzyme
LGVVGVATEEAILEVLKTVYDPEIPINILDLGLIYGIDIEGSNVHIIMTLTAPHCPMSGVIVKNVKEKIEAMEGVNKADVELVWDPIWSPYMISKEAMKKPNEK